MFELIDPIAQLPIGFFETEELCHQKAENLKLINYCIETYTYQGLLPISIGIDCWEVKPEES